MEKQDVVNKGFLDMIKINGERIDGLVKKVNELVVEINKLQ